jgi:hypothetical protein
MKLKAMLAPNNSSEDIAASFQTGVIVVDDAQGRTAPSPSDSSINDVLERVGAVGGRRLSRRGAGLFRSTKDVQDYPLRTSASD